MQIAKNIYIVASGESAFSITNALDCTAFLISGKDECALIDAGCGLQPQLIIEQIKSHGFEPSQIKKIFLTHGHGDHAAGAAYLADKCGAKVFALKSTAKFVSQADAKALSLKDAIKAGVYPENFVFNPCKVTAIKHKDVFDIGGLTLSVIKTEGHCAGHASFLLDDGSKKYLFVGDVLQCTGSIALQAIWDCDLAKYISTIKRLSKVNFDALLPAHGCIALNNGQEHVNKAQKRINNLMLPKNNIDT